MEATRTKELIVYGKKMRNAELYLKGADLFTACSRLQQDCQNYHQLKVRKTRTPHWFYSEYLTESQSKLSTDHSAGEPWHEVVEAHFAQLIGDH